ncbi:hypothetical protein XENOCAPTIV_006818, partial [Xenoophorus captivus]
MEGSGVSSTAGGAIPTAWSQRGCSSRARCFRSPLERSMEFCWWKKFLLVCLCSGGQVYSLGELPWKQTQVLQTTKPTLENALSGQRVVAVAAGSFHSGAVTEDGSVHMWGDNGAGQCGLSGLSCVPNPTPVALPDTGGAQTVPVLELACGEKHSLALSVQREVWAWGSGCQLGLNATVFPVWKPQKLEQLAGRYVLQVACGASHSLALVRCLGPEGVQRPPVDKCNQCNQLLYTMTDKEDHVIISDSHYCPVGVEAKEETPPTQTLKTSPSEPILPSHSSSTSTPAAPTSDPSLDPVSGPQDSQKARLTNGVQPPPDSDTPVPPKAAASSVVKSSPYPDEQEVKEYLRKLSDTSQAEAKMAAGGLHALQVSIQICHIGGNLFPLHADLLICFNWTFTLNPRLMLLTSFLYFCSIII